MTERPTGLGRRLGRVFLLKATLISLAAVIGVYAAGTTIEEVLIRRALEEEADHFWKRFSDSALFPVPDTRNLTGFLARGADRSGVPAPFAALGPGFHNLDTAADFSVVYVTERDAEWRKRPRRSCCSPEHPIRGSSRRRSVSTTSWPGNASAPAPWPGANR